MTKRQRLASSVEGAADEARGDEGNLARAQQVIKADDLVIRVERPLPPPEFSSPANCLQDLGISEAVFRRVVKRLPHRREHGEPVVRRELIVAELANTGPVEETPAKPKPAANQNASAAELLERSGFKRAI